MLSQSFHRLCYLVTIIIIPLPPKNTQKNTHTIPIHSYKFTLMSLVFVAFLLICIHAYIGFIIFYSGRNYTDISLLHYLLLHCNNQRCLLFLCCSLENLKICQSPDDLVLGLEQEDCASFNAQDLETLLEASRITVRRPVWPRV